MATRSGSRTSSRPRASSSNWRPTTCSLGSKSSTRSSRSPSSGPSALGGRDRRGLVEPEFLHRGLAHLELLDLARDGHRERVDELDVTGDLVTGDLRATELADLLLVGL